MFAVNSEIILSGSTPIEKAEAIQQRILQLAKTPEEAQAIVDYLASLNWGKIVIQTQREQLKRTLREMGNFIKGRVKGGGFCDECKQIKYVGGYHHGEQHNKVYSWPHKIAPYALANNTTAGKLYCWKHLEEMQYDTEQELIKDFIQKHPEHKSSPFLYWKDKILKCNDCGRLFPQRAAYMIKRDAYCLHCVESGIYKQFIHCKSCNKKTASATDGYCYDCYQTSLRIGPLVNAHLGRAREANTPATLTAKQWEKAIADFGGRCAYCQSRPFQVLEHFIPISQGGGTTADNCVPACSRCNNKKGGVHPDNLNNFPPHVLTRVRDYLKSNKEEIKPCSIAGRELVIYQPTTSK